MSDFRKSLPFLALLLSGTLCASMIVPYMGFYIVESLSNPPWVMSIYATLAISLALVFNRQIARRLDGGARVFPLIGFAIAGYCLATFALSALPVLAIVLSLGIVGFAMSSSAMATMFTTGRAFADRAGIDGTRFNSFMRATTSTAWMMGPAISFMVADQMSHAAVFKVGAAFALVWIALWLRIIPRDMTALGKTVPNTAQTSGKNLALWAAVTVCFLLSLAHAITFSALPLFFVQEVDLPTYAPGLHFSIKTFVEVFAILSTPWLITRFGLRNMLGVSVLMGALAIQILAMVQSLPQMILGSAIEGLYYGLFASLSITFVQSFAKDRIGHATALYWNAIMATGLLAGPAVGLIAQYDSFHLAVQSASLFALLSLTVLIVTRRLSAPQTTPIR